MLSTFCSVAVENLICLSHSFPPGSTRHPWAKNIQGVAESQECRLHRIVHCKVSSRSRHEFLVVYVRHPSGKDAVVLAKREGDTSSMAPSLDRVRVGALVRHPSKAHTLRFPKTSPAPPVAHLAALLVVLEQHVLSSNTSAEARSGWYAYCVTEVMREIFGGSVKTTKGWVKVPYGGIVVEVRDELGALVREGGFLARHDECAIDVVQTKGQGDERDGFVCRHVTDDGPLIIDCLLIACSMAIQDVFSIDHDEPANLPSQNPTRSYWADANPLAREGSAGPLTVDADVCIIGSGFTGVGIAYHLSEAVSQLQYPLKVVMLEARDFCSGATGRNGGHLTPAAFSGFDARANKYGPDEARRSYALEAHTASSFLRLIRDHGWTDDVDLVDGGHIDLLFTDQHIEEVQRDLEAAVRAGWSLDGVVELGQDEVHATLGAHYPAVKIPGYNLWPLKLVTKLFEHAKMRTTCLELVLHTHTPVTAVEPANNLGSVTTSVCKLSTPRGTITCSRVVHATNAYASHLLPFLAGREGIVPVRGQVLTTRASVSSDEIKRHSWSGNEGFEYWFPRPVKTIDENPLIVLGGGREAAPPPSEAYVDDDTTCHPDVGATLRAFLPAVFQGKFEPGREPEMEWTGIMGYTKIKDPFVGPIDKLPAIRGDAARYTGQFIAAGYSGHGVPRAFACAEVVAQMIVAEMTGTVWIQPDWLPTRYLTWVDRGPIWN